MEWFELTKTSVLENFKNKENFSLLMTKEDYDACLEMKNKYLDIYKDHHQDSNILQNIFNVEVTEKYKLITYDSFVSWLCVFMLSDMELCKVFNREVRSNTIIVTLIWSNDVSNMNKHAFKHLEGSV